MADSLVPSPLVKLVILPTTRVGLGREGLRNYLETIHGPMVVRETEVSGRFASYVHHYAQDLVPANDGRNLPDRDALTIIRFPTLADLVASKANAAYRERIGPDEDNFREIAGSVALLADEIEVAAGVDDAPHKLFIFRNAAPGGMDGWTGKLGKIVRDNGLPGAVINSAKIVEGHFPYTQFDEVGLPISIDPASLVDVIKVSALEHFGDVETGLLLAETVRFI